MHLAFIYRLSQNFSVFREGYRMAVEDELSNLIKYKAGNLVYIYSMYMCLVVFMLKDHFPNNGSLIGSGISLSALIFGTSRFIVKKTFT
jgi:hypothetical protein